MKRQAAIEFVTGPAGRLGWSLAPCEGNRYEFDHQGPDAKFDSDTGRPGFFAPVDGVALSMHADGSLFMRRTECAAPPAMPISDHVFPDHPRPAALLHQRDSH
jgi:SelR domain